MTINGTRWTIGWSPKQVIVGFLVGGVVVGAMADAVGGFAFVGFLAGVGVWFWGRSEVNSKYLSLLEDFRDQSRRRIERETGGMEVSSAHTFVSASGDSPALIDPARTYRTAHLLFGDTSVVVNRQYEFDMKERTQRKGGKQQEVFYDQISNVQSEDYRNYAELEISLSSGDTERIRGRDTAGINEVKADLQQKMRDARRATRRPREPSAPAATRASAGGAERGSETEAAASEATATGTGAPTPDAETGDSTDAPASDGAARAAPEPDDGATSAAADDGAVSTDWLADAPDDPALVVRNDGVDPESVRVGCRADGEEELADEVRLAPGETADWEAFTDATRFEIAVIVRDGPSAGKRFDLAEDGDEILVSVTDADVAFGVDEPATTPAARAAETDAESTPAPDPGPSDGGDATTADTASTSGADAASADEAGGSTGDDGASRGSTGSSIADKVFGGADDADESSDADAGADDPADEPESWDDAAALAAAVRESASRERVERLTEFLDAPTEDERLAAAAALRESVSAHPEPVARAVPALAALLEEDDPELREAAMGALRGLARTRPDAVAEAADACIDRLDDESPKMRTAACRVLEAVDATEATGKLERLADEDSHKGVQVAAFQAVQSLDG